MAVDPSICVAHNWAIAIEGPLPMWVPTLTQFMRGTHENWCLRTYLKLYQNVMKHMPTNEMNVVTFITNDLIYGSELCYVPVCRSFSTFSERVSTRWSTGKIQPSFWMTPVRPAASMLVNISTDSLLVAFIKLIHVIGGIYMCVCLHWQESTNWYRIATIESQLGNCVYSWFRVGHVTKKKTVQVDNMGEPISPYSTSRPLQSWWM